MVKVRALRSGFFLFGGIALFAVVSCSSDSKTGPSTTADTGVDVLVVPDAEADSDNDTTPVEDTGSEPYVPKPYVPPLTTYIYEVVAPAVDEKYAQDLADTFGILQAVTHYPEDGVGQYGVEDGAKTLKVWLANGAFLYELTGGGADEADLETKDEAIAYAEGYLSAKNLKTDGYVAVGATKEIVWGDWKDDEELDTAKELFAWRVHFVKELAVDPNNAALKAPVSGLKYEVSVANKTVIGLSGTGLNFEIKETVESKTVEQTDGELEVKTGHSGVTNTLYDYKLMYVIDGSGKTVAPQVGFVVDTSHHGVAKLPLTDKTIQMEIPGLIGVPEGSPTKLYTKLSGGTPPYQASWILNDDNGKRYKGVGESIELDLPKGNYWGTVTVTDSGGGVSKGSSKIFVGIESSIPNDDSVPSIFEFVDVGNRTGCSKDSDCSGSQCSAPNATSKSCGCVVNPETGMGKCMVRMAKFNRTIKTSTGTMTWKGTANIPRTKANRADGLEIHKLQICDVGLGTSCKNVQRLMLMPYYTIATTGMSTHACDLGFHPEQTQSTPCHATLVSPGIKIQPYLDFIQVYARWRVLLKSDKPGYCDARLAITQKYRLEGKRSNSDFLDFVGGIIQMRPEVVYDFEALSDGGCTPPTLTEFAAHQRFDINLEPWSTGQFYKDDDCAGFIGSTNLVLGSLAKETWALGMDYGGLPGVFDNYHERTKTSNLRKLAPFPGPWPISIPGCTDLLSVDAWKCVHVHWRWGAEVAKKASKNYGGYPPFAQLVPKTQRVEVATVKRIQGELEPPPGVGSLYSVKGLLGSSTVKSSAPREKCNGYEVNGCTNCIEKGGTLGNDLVFWMITRSNTKTAQINDRVGFFIR